MKHRFVSFRSLLILIFLVIVFVLWFNVSIEQKDEDTHIRPERVERYSDLHQAITDIKCYINDEYFIPCLKKDDKNESSWLSQVFLPFSFIQKYFDIYGRVITSHHGEQVLAFQHSYSKVIYPQAIYSPSGPFLWFQNFNVEDRDRVKFVSALHGVPVSNQWDPLGHIYPVQVAQFGLSHFSKNITTKKVFGVTLEDGTFRQIHWQWMSLHDSKSLVETDKENGKDVLSIRGRATFQVKPSAEDLLTMEINFKPLSRNFSFTIFLHSEKQGKTFKVNFISSDEEVSVRSGSVFYGFGEGFQWKHLTRNLMTDVIKGRLLVSLKNRSKIQLLRISKIVFKGDVMVRKLSLLSTSHDAQARDAAEYLVKSQDHRGGWTVKVTRRLSGGELVLKPGWYSAMAQGQAMSFLSRMYKATRDRKYLDSAIRAINLFFVNSSDGGIRTFFADKYVWFEEYPTTPSTFVLNGFIYSLFGLYDMKMTCGNHECPEATELFKAGLKSLNTLLPLFDTGSGTLYDLRHFSLHGPPNLARWDYHTTHINQLLHLETVVGGLNFQATAKRWISYMKGHRAPHN